MRCRSDEETWIASDLQHFPILGQGAVMRMRCLVFCQLVQPLQVY